MQRCEISHLSAVNAGRADMEDLCATTAAAMPNNDMGMDENITNATFEKAADVMGMSIKESRQNALELLEKVLASNEESSDKNWQP